MARILVGISGGIAAYKSLEAVRLAVKAGHSVRVIQTPTSERFVGKASFQSITGAPVLLSEFEPDPARGAYPGEPFPSHLPISHLALVERAEVYLIAPASANTLAKLAHGHADNLVTEAALVARCPLAIAPAMNHAMYTHPTTQENIRVLAQRGATIIPPAVGELASHGERGIGRLAEPPELLAACERLLSTSDRPLKDTRVLVTAGGTREPIDSVRFIGNRSSGRMGIALAKGAARRGADVILIAANVRMEPPAGAQVIPVGTAAELADACEREFGSCDILLMAAAVADFRPARPAPEKLKKDAGVPSAIELESTPDVLGALASRQRPHQVLIGFAAEHGGDAVARGREKLERKALDAVVVNDISRSDIGFEVSDNEVVIVTPGGEQRVDRTSKTQVAEAVLDVVQRLRAAKEDRDGADRAEKRSAGAV